MLARESLQRILQTEARAASWVDDTSPRNDRGVALDYQVHRLLSLYGLQGGIDPVALGVETTRLIYDRANLLTDFDEVSLLMVQDRVLRSEEGEFPIRIYRPGPGRLPALLYFHGGGFTIGSIEGYDRLCRWLAKKTGAVVISVGYRLAPEWPFPRGIEDGLYALRWIRRHAEALNLLSDRIGLAGDSAGATMSEVITQQLIEAGEDVPFHRVLIYPKTDHRRLYESRELFAEGFLLSKKLLDWFEACYLPSVFEPDDRRISPLCYDRLAEMGPATVVTAGFDPLRDEGEAYVAALREAGNEVKHFSFDTLIHGFVVMGGVIDQARRELEELAGQVAKIISE